MLKNYSKIEIDKSGTKRYLNDEGKEHRLDGPALEFSYGTKFWFVKGKEHRNIDPTAEYSVGEKSWRFKDKFHRIGSFYYKNFWFIHGKVYSKKEYYNKVWDI